MTPTETGLYGCPSDYGPHFRTLEYQFSRRAEYHNEHTIGGSKWSPWDIECAQRSAVVTALIELAHDLDARGLVLVDMTDLIALQRDAWSAGVLAAPILAPSPNTGS